MSVRTISSTPILLMAEQMGTELDADLPGGDRRLHAV